MVKMNELFMKLLYWAITALLAALVSLITARVKLRKEKRENKDSAMEERLEQLDKVDEILGKGIRSMLRQNIINAYDKYTTKGWAKVYVKDNVQEMYDCYHALGGNGTITHLVEEFMDLPTKEDEKL